MPTSTHAIEGSFTFHAPTGEECTTWYKIIGDIDQSPPLITLHGGPGSGHDYLSPLDRLNDQYGMPIIHYDQVGCGNSTHFRDKPGDESFWTIELYLKELESLISHLGLRDFHILGQSWGGMLGAEFAARRPSGLKKLILASGPASVPLWIEGANRLLSELPKDVRETLEECIRRDDYESPEYEKASAVYYGRHLCRLETWPADLLASFQKLNEDKTAYLTMQGPSEFVINGTIKDWEGWKFGHKIEAETLLLNGRYDEMVDACVQPWFDTIPEVKWVTLEKASHMGQWEDQDRFVGLCGSFLFPTSSST